MVVICVGFWGFFFFLAYQTCAVVDPNTGFAYNLTPLASKTGYNTSGNGKKFLVRHFNNILPAYTISANYSSQVLHGSVAVLWKTLHFCISSDIFQMVVLNSNQIKHCEEGI